MKLLFYNDQSYSRLQYAMLIARLVGCQYKHGTLIFEGEGKVERELKALALIEEHKIFGYGVSHNDGKIYVGIHDLTLRIDKMTYYKVYLKMAELDCLFIRTMQKDDVEEMQKWIAPHDEALRLIIKESL